MVTPVCQARRGADDEQPRGLPEPLDPGARGRVRARRRIDRLYGVVEKPDFALVRARQRRTASGWSSSSATPSAAGRGSSRRAPGPAGERAGRREELARAELAEETGLRAGRLRHLGHLDLASGPDDPGVRRLAGHRADRRADRAGGDRGRHAAGLRPRGRPAPDDRATAGSPTARRSPPTASCCSTAPRPDHAATRWAPRGHGPIGCDVRRSGACCIRAGQPPGCPGAADRPRPPGPPARAHRPCRRPAGQAGPRDPGGPTRCPAAAGTSPSGTATAWSSSGTPPPPGCGASRAATSPTASPTSPPPRSPRCRPGTVLDGEVVIWHDDRLDFGLLQKRMVTAPGRIAAQVAAHPASYVAFDVLAARRHRPPRQDARPPPGRAGDARRPAGRRRCSCPRAPPTPSWRSSGSRTSGSRASRAWSPRAPAAGTRPAAGSGSR